MNASAGIATQAHIDSHLDRCLLTDRMKVPHVELRRDGRLVDWQRIRNHLGDQNTEAHIQAGGQTCSLTERFQCVRHIGEQHGQGKDSQLICEPWTG